MSIPFSRGIFPTQGLNLGLPRCGQIPYSLRHEGSLSYARKKLILNQSRVAKPSSSRRRGALSLGSVHDAALDLLPGRRQRSATPGAGPLPEGCRDVALKCLCWVALQHLEKPHRTSKLLYFEFRDIHTRGSFIIKYLMCLKQNHNIITRSLPCIDYHNNWGECLPCRPKPPLMLCSVCFLLLALGEQGSVEIVAGVKGSLLEVNQLFMALIFNYLKKQSL